MCEWCVCNDLVLVVAFMCTGGRWHKAVRGVIALTRITSTCSSSENVLEVNVRRRLQSNASNRRDVDSE